MRRLNKTLILVAVTAFLMMSLVACQGNVTPKVSEIRSKLTANEYTVSTGETAEGIEYSVAGHKGTDFVLVIAFKDAEFLKNYQTTDAYNSHKAVADKSDNVIIKTVGTAIIMGTKAAVKLI